MVRKVQKSKPKASSLASSTSGKKGTAKAKKEEKLSNGYGDAENEKPESKAEVKSTEVETSEVMDTIPEEQENVDSVTEENATDSVQEVQSAEMKEVTSKDYKTVPKSRKRKAATNIKDKKEVITKTRSKKQKVVLEIPKRNTIPGKVFVIGENGVGQLGLGEDIVVRRRPALLDLPHSIVDIVAGGMHSVCLTESGEVITFGCNDEGALGRITSEEGGSEYIPQKIDIPERIVQVSAGDSHTAALSESGQVYIWGNFRNGNGVMGLVTIDAKQCTPVKILNDITVVKIASGNDHLACLSQEGVIYTCGCADAGQLGRVSGHACLDGGRKGKNMLITPGKVSVSKSNKSCTANNIWTGSYATVLKIQETGSIYAFGLNNFSQLGLENENTILKPKELVSFGNNSWLHISGGQHHTLGLDDDGLVYSLGRSDYGRLGLGENSDEVKSVPTAIPSLQDKKCVDISGGNCVSFAVTDNGSVYSWGMGDNHQLGHGDDSDQHSPRLIEGNFFNSWKAFKISSGGQHTLILAHPKKSSEKSQ